MTGVFGIRRLIFSKIDENPAANPKPLPINQKANALAKAIKKDGKELRVINPAARPIHEAIKISGINITRTARNELDQIPVIRPRDRYRIPALVRAMIIRRMSLAARIKEYEVGLNR